MNNTSPCVLILGGGMAGISIGRHLWDAGYKNFLIIEGRPVLGGRIRSVKLKNTDLMIEEGANWIHDNNTDKLNSLWKFVYEINLNTQEQNDKEFVFFKQGSNDPLSPSLFRWENFMKAYDCYDEKRRYIIETNQADVNMSELFARCGWSSNNIYDAFVEWFMIDYDYGVCPNETGSIAKPFDDRGNGGNNFFVTDHRGYVSILDQVALPFLNDSSKFALNSRVLSVQYSCSGVNVTVNEGGVIKKYNGDYAISTFSQGVLQRSIGRFNNTANIVEYSPEFPIWKKNAINKISLAYYTKLWLMFPFPFWDDRVDQIAYASTNRGWWPSWLNLNRMKQFEGYNILLGTVTGQHSKWVSFLQDDDIQTEVMDVIRQMYPSAPNPIAFHVSRWSTDEWTYGSFSSYDMNTDRNDAKLLYAPLGRLFFAGEATDPIDYGTVHGAYNSGQRVVNEIVSDIERSYVKE